MKKLKSVNLFLLFGMLLIFGACQAGEGLNGENESPKITATFTVVPPLWPSATPKPPTATPTPLPPVEFVPRYMLPSAPYYPVLVLGAQCNYQNDSWNEQSAYIAYTCPDLNVLWISVRFTTLGEGQTAQDLFGELPGEGAILITPGAYFIGEDTITMAGRSEGSEYAYFMVYETDRYVISVEMFFPEDNSKSVEEFYEGNADVVLNMFLEIMVGKVNDLISDPEPTPMTFDQKSVYDEASSWLVTELEANEFYEGATDMWGDLMDGTWRSYGDDVDGTRESICRQFLDRTNADAPLVKLFNCIIHVGPNYDLNSILEARPFAVPLESAYNYPDQSIIYALDLSNGHMTLNAFVLKNDYLFHISIETRVKSGQTAEEVFTAFNDGLIYDVLTSNFERFSPQVAETLLFKDLFYRSIDPSWDLIRLNDGQWNVTQQSGLLKIYLANANQLPDTLLLRWITEQDFEIITRVLFEPKRNFQRAGIVVYENRDNFVAIVRAYTDWDGGIGNGIFIDHASPTTLSWDDPNFDNYETQISSRDDVYLKLRREQDVYTGYYSIDGETWILVGELTSPIEPVSHGLLIGKSDTEIFVNFDFYELHSLD